MKSALVVRDTTLRHLHSSAKGLQYKASFSIPKPLHSIPNRALSTSSVMSGIHTPIPTLKLNDGTSIPMVRAIDTSPYVLELTIYSARIWQ